MAGLLPWDTLFLAGFAYSGYRTIGRWLKYTDDTAKAQSDGAYIEGFREFLAEQAASGNRSKSTPGLGADASGQAHLWRDWNGMKTKQRIALLGEMQQVLEWTGQDEAHRLVKKYRGQPWSALPHKAKKALLAAADQLDWSFLDDMAADGAALASSAHLWQVNEAVPQLSAEPALAEALLEDATGLQELVNSADLAVNALLTNQQEAVISALSPALDLQVVEAKRKVDMLREAAQGGLGLGSGGKAQRGQQLLELLRGINLTPESAADQEAKAAAVAALAAAADEAVTPLKEQHASALAAATAAARNQALATQLGSPFRFSPGKPVLTVPVAIGVISVAADEAASGLASLAASDASVAARRNAAEQLMGMASIIDSTAAALASEFAEDDEASSKVLGPVFDAAEKLQEASIKYAELKLKSDSAKPQAEAQEGDESAATAENPVAAAAAAVEEALQAVRLAAEKLSGLAGPAGPAAAEGDVAEGEADAPTADSVRERVYKAVDEQVEAVETRTKQQQEAALQNALSRERMSQLLAKAKTLMTPPPPAAAEGEEASADTAAAEPAMTSAEKLSVVEEYLKQLGNRPLAAALTDLDKLIEVQAGDKMKADALASGVALDAASQANLSRLGELLSEIDLADSVMILELGPKVTSTLELLTAYMARLKAKSDSETADEAAGAEPVQSPKQHGMSPNSLKEQEAVERCTTLIDDLKKDGLVVLSLSSAQYRQLGMLREVVSSLSVSLDALKYDRCVAALKDVQSQLGPIGAAIQTKLAATEDEETRTLMAQQKTLAVDLYSKLQAFLSFEEAIRGPLKKCLRELGSLAGGIGAPRSTSGCSAAALKLEMASEEAQKLQDLLADLASHRGEAAGEGEAPAAADSVAATQKVVETLQGSVEALQGSLASLAAHVALRTRALNPEVAAAAAAAGLEGEDVDLNTLEHMEPELDHPLHILSATAEDQQAEWEATGFEQVARGRVATVLIATATTDAAHTHPADAAKPAAASAGSDGDVPRVAVGVSGLPSGKSVLQLTAERILRLQQLAAAAVFGVNAPVSRYVQWYIMTSPATHDKLQTILKEHHHYGLNPGQVTLFCCKTAPPAFAGEPLKAVQMGSSTLTRGQPGSGEVFATLKRSGALNHMKRSGIRHVEINAVDDNVLARPADPLFIGFAVDQGLDASAKVVEPSSVSAAYAAAMVGSSSSAGEGAGAAAAAAQGVDEAISFLAPGIGSYYFSFSALNRAAGFYEQHPLGMYRLVPASKLPSKAPPPAMSVNLPPNATQAQRMQAQQALVAAQQAAAAAPPKPVEGCVPTRFISDVFATSSPETPTAGAASDSPLAGAAMAYLAVDREEEFSCVLGGGPHLAVLEPEIAAGDLLALTTSWVETQGAVVECEEGVEVSPLVSYAGEGLDIIAGKGAVFAEPYDLTLQGATGLGRAKHNAGPWAVPVLVAYAAGAGLAVVKQLASK